MRDAHPNRLLLLTFVLFGCSRAAPSTADAAPAAEEAPSAKVVMAKAVRGDVRDTLSIDGNFARPEGATSRLAPVAGGRLLSVTVKEGDRIVAGQILARLDGRALAAQSQSAAAGAASASATAAQTELSLRAAQADQLSAVRAARIALDVAISEGRAAVQTAQADLRTLLAGRPPQEIAQAEQAVQAARVARDKARLDADRDRRLLAEGLVAGSQADASAAALATADTGVRSAQAALDLVRAGARPQELRAARERLGSARDLARKRESAARATLAQAESGRLAVDAKRQEVAAARLTAAGKSADARVAAAGALTTEIRSPLTGVVVRRFLNPGDVTDPTTPVLAVAQTLPQTDFVGNVSPEEAARVEVGMVALLPALTGRVVAVGEADPATGLVPVRVRCAGTAPNGGFATARIVLRTVRGAPTVPKAALLARHGKNVVFVVRDGVAHRTEVETGPEENGRVAILKGVSAGASVVVLGGLELSDGTRVEAAEPAKTEETP